MSDRITKMRADEALEKLSTIESPEIDVLKSITRRPTLSDVMRVGATVTEKETGGWGDGVNTACALSAAEIGLQFLSEH